VDSAHRLTALARHPQRVARVGRTEFALVVRAGAQAVASVTAQALARLQRPIVVDGLQMARTLGLRVIAEGAETEEQGGLLVAMGCDGTAGLPFRPAVSATALARQAERDEAVGTATFRSPLFHLTQPA